MLTEAFNRYTLTHVAMDGSTITMTFEADTLSDVLDSMQQFLAGCGFHIKGTLDIVEEEE